MLYKLGDVISVSQVIRYSYEHTVLWCQVRIKRKLQLSTLCSWTEVVGWGLDGKCKRRLGASLEKQSEKNQNQLPVSRM